MTHPTTTHIVCALLTGVSVAHAATYTDDFERDALAGGPIAYVELTPAGKPAAAGSIATLKDGSLIVAGAGGETGRLALEGIDAADVSIAMRVEFHNRDATANADDQADKPRHSVGVILRTASTTAFGHGTPEAPGTGMLCVELLNSGDLLVRERDTNGKLVFLSTTRNNPITGAPVYTYAPGKLGATRNGRPFDANDNGILEAGEPFTLAVRVVGNNIEVRLNDEAIFTGTTKADTGLDGNGVSLLKGRPGRFKIASTLHLDDLALETLSESAAAPPPPASSEVITRHEHRDPATGIVTPYLLYEPAASARPSLLVYLHGAGGSIDNYNLKREPYAQLRAALLERGYFIVVPELGPKHFMNDAAKARLDAVIAQVLNERGIPADRVHLMGTSMGGGSALAYAIHRPDTVRSVCAIMPMTDFAAWITERPSYAVPVGEAFGGSPADAPDAYRANSAIHHADAFARIPVLLLHGRDDVTVQFHHSADLHDALRAKGYRAELIAVDGMAHQDAIVQPHQSAIANFIEACNRGDKER